MRHGNVVEKMLPQGDRQLDDSAEIVSVGPPWRAFQFQSWKALEQHAQANTYLLASEHGSGTRMMGEPERQMPIRLSVWVKFIRLVEDFWIAVGRRKPCNHTIPLSDRHIGDLAVPGSDPHGCLCWAFKTQHLFNNHSP